MTSRNVAFSQPYYSRHDWVHLRRGETKAFLKDYYNSVAGLADRDTYTFWEHFFHQSPHKTHEEAWFLMQTRWMLYMEHGDTLEHWTGIYNRIHRGTVTVLPPREGRPVPNVEHMLLHAGTLATALVTLSVYASR